MPENDPLIISRREFDAMLFDLDGVITRTVDLHPGAWKRLFDEFMTERSAQGGEDLRPFDIDRDYRRDVDGRPRYQGVRHFLAARHIELPMGEPADPPERETMCGLGNRTNQLFREAIEEQGVGLYGCAVALVHRLRKAESKTAVVSASKNCALILRRAGISELFGARVDGIEAERLELDGKPDPDTSMEAVRRLGVAPDRAAVVEDAIAGVTAGKRGRFALVIGIDRGGYGHDLTSHGADVVVEGLCRVEVEATVADDGPPPPALTELGLFSQQLAHRLPACFLDYDGTLTPIVERPEDALLSAPMRAALTAAARRFPVAIISGRDLEDVHNLVGIPELVYAGSHGFDIAGPGLRLELPAGAKALGELQQAADELVEPLAAIAGTRLEHKRFAIAVHYRQVADAYVPEVESHVDEVAKRHPQLRKTGGKKVCELRPAIDWDKGQAVRWLIAELGLDRADVLPIYIGDDVTDEDAFRALLGRGLGILVAHTAQPSLASLRLSDPDQVRALLLHLVETLESAR
jgi:trehalose 6-phosphate phosphatase